MFKVGVFGSAHGEALHDAVVKENVEMLGKELAAHECIVITGACGGIPYAVAAAAHGLGARVWGFSPARDREEHAAWYPEQRIALYEQLICVPPDIAQMESAVRRKYRNVMSTAHCVAGIIVAGRWGTLHEFCSLYDYGKVIGVLTGTGGVADELLALMTRINKESGAEVVFRDDPKELIEQVIAQLEERNGRGA